MKLEPNSAIPFDDGGEPRREPDLRDWKRRHSGVQQEKAKLMTTEILSFSEIREERVKVLRLAIAEGRYQVTSKQIAEAMLNEFLPPANCKE